MTLAALALLLAAAAAVIFVLPDAVRDAPTAAGAGAADTGREPRGAAPRAPRAAAPARPAAGPPAPPAEPDPARLRAEAALADALAQQARLEAARVAQWGGEDHARALSRLAAGDDAFANAEFEAAAGRYAEAAAAFAALDQDRPRRLDAALAAGAGALAGGDAAAALAAFETALAIDPANDAARAGLARAQTLDQVLALHASAMQRESAGDLDAARAALEQALAVDPAFDDARSALARVAAAIEERDFAAAMSRALDALQRGDRAAAADALAQARAVRATDPALADGMRRLALAQQHARLASLRADARAHEDAGRWTEAIRSYEQALEVDANAGFARDGVARSRERLAFEQRVDAYLAAPEKLASDAPLADAQQLLDAARALGPAPPGAARKLARLRELVDAARTPVPVTVRSDGATEVVVHRVARLGRVSRHTLSLRPGRYVAVGTRPGFRDVRREFTVDAGEAPTVTVICEERL